MDDSTAVAPATTHSALRALPRDARVDRPLCRTGGNVKDLQDARVPSEELTVFTREYAAMHDAGISLVRGLEFYAGSTRTDLGRICADMVVKMETGWSLSRSMRAYPEVFSEVYTSLVEAGEHSGELRDILRKLADLQERTRTLRQRVVATLTYPAVLMVASLGCLLFFMIAILPSILELFVSLRIKLPFFTRVLAESGALLQRPSTWLGMGLLAYGVAHLFKRFRQRMKESDELRLRVESFILRLPIAGPVIEKLVAARMIYTISTLLQAGVFLENALQKAGKVSGNLVFDMRMRDAVEDIHNGDTMSEALGRHRVFPRSVLQIIAASEEAGGLVTSLQYAAALYEEDVEVALANLSAMMEPLILVGMGGLSAFIVLSIILPTVQLLNNL